MEWNGKEQCGLNSREKKNAPPLKPQNEKEPGIFFVAQQNH